MKKRTRFYAASIFTALNLLLLVACGGGNSSSIDTKSKIELPPNPNGILLDTNFTSIAMMSTVNLPPSPVAADKIVDGLLTTRLDAILNPAATVAEVNNALKNNNARIVSMKTSSPFVTLVIDPVANGDAAAAKATEVAATNAFLFANAAYTPKQAAANPIQVSLAITARNHISAGHSLEAAPAPPHLVAMRMIPAWNASRLAVRTAQFVPVIVADDYANGNTHPDIAVQTFLPGNGIFNFDPTIGNWGFSTSGILGGNVQAATFTAVHPQPQNLLSIRSLPISGLSWREIIFEIADSLPDSGNFVVNTSLNYTTSFTEYSKTQRTIDALAWRWMAGRDGRAERFVHATSAGDFGVLTGDAATANYSSPFAIAEAFTNLSLIVDIDNPSESLNYIDAVMAIGGEPERLGNLLVVGSSTAESWVRSDFSSPGEDVRVIGENIHAPCVITGSGCDGTSWTKSSTWVATPQVAGLMTYLWNLSPTRSPADIVSIIDYAYNNASRVGVIDAYAAVLALDRNIMDPRVRKAILDVAADTDVFSETGNDIFDHRDIKVFIDKFAEASSDPRFDLNGDGKTGGSGTAWFDLDINQPPSYESVSQDIPTGTESFDEQAVTDLVVLCYYAYSDLFHGDVEARDILLEECTPTNGSTPIRAGYTDARVAAYAVLPTRPGSPIEMVSSSKEREMNEVSWADTVSENISRVVVAYDLNTSLSATAAGSLNFVLDSGQNLTSISGGANISASGDIDISKNYTCSPDGLNRSRTRSQGSYEMTMSFDVKDGEVPYSFNFNWNQILASNPGMNGLIVVSLGGGETPISRRLNIPADSASGEIIEMGTLLPGGYSLTITAQVWGIFCVRSPETEAGDLKESSSLSLDYTLTLTPRG